MRRRGRWQTAAWFGMLWLALSQGASAAEPLKWGNLPPLPDPVGFAGPFVGVSHDALIVAGGANFPDARPWDGGEKVWHDRIFVLPSPDGQWIETPTRLPRALAYGVSVTTDQGVLCAGGSDSQRHYADVFLLKWNPQRRDIEIVELPDLPAARAMATGCQYQGKAYVIGGLESPDATDTCDEVWHLDPSNPTATWEAIPSLPSPRMLAVAGVQDGGLYVLSGVDLHASEDGSAVREYLTDGFRWSGEGGWTEIAKAPKPFAAAPYPAPALGGSHLLLLGGDDGQLADRVSELRDDHPGFSPEAWAYHTVTDTWTKLASIPADQQDGADLNLKSPVTTIAVSWHGKLVIPSGEVRPAVRTSQVMTIEPLRVTSGFHTLDGIVIAVYLAALVCVGVWFSRSQEGTDEFFLGGRRIPWWAAGISIFGTQLSAITFMAVPALVYRTNWVYFLGNMTIVAMAPIVVWIYLPFFRRLNITSAYEYLELRFSMPARMLGSASFVALQLGRMGIVLYLPALALAAVTGVDIYVCIVLMGVLATVYTVLGGIEAVIWTDVLQVVVLVGGALLCLSAIVAGLDGGLSTLISEGLRHDKFRLAEFQWDLAAPILSVVVFGKFFEQFISYTADQTVVQRYLTTATERQAAHSIWTNALLTIPATLLFFMIGTGLWAFYRQHPELLNVAGQTDDIFPWFIAQQLPAGVSGVVLAALFAAAMSSLDSSMNSMATVITTDFYRRLVPNLSDEHCLRVARWLTLLLGILGTGSAIAMAMYQSKSMWDQYTQVVQLLGGGLAGLFACGILSRRIGSTSAILGFVASAAILYWVATTGLVHLLLYAAIGMVSCFVVAWLTSWIFPASTNIDGLTWSTRDNSRPNSPGH